MSPELPRALHKEWSVVARVVSKLIGQFPTIRGPLFGSPENEDHSILAILGSTLGPLIVVNSENVAQEARAANSP